MKCAQKGFTLIEIMIVVAIIAILAAIAIPNFISYRNTSLMNACKANQKAIVAAAEAYRMNPNHTEAPSAITIASLTDTSKGGYLKNEPKCGGKSYTLSYDTMRGIFTANCGNSDTGGDEFKHQETVATTTTTP